MKRRAEAGLCGVLLGALLLAARHSTRSLRAHPPSPSPRAPTPPPQPLVPPPAAPQNAQPYSPLFPPACDLFLRRNESHAARLHRQRYEARGRLPSLDPLLPLLCHSRRLPARGNCFSVRTRNSSRTLCLPSFLVVGFTKAGTSVFFQYLAQHKLVRTSPLKEPAYFGSDAEATDAARPYALHAKAKTLRWYMALFGACTRCERGEATPGYAWRDFSPIAMQQAYHLLGGGTWIVMLVREPLHRAASHYLYFNKTRGRFRRSSNLSEALAVGLAEFERCILQLGGWAHLCTYRDGRRAAEAAAAALHARRPQPWRLRRGKASYELIQAGLYSEHIATWRARFAARQLLVLDADDLIRRPLRALRRFERHAGLPCAKYALSDRHALPFTQPQAAPGVAAHAALRSVGAAQIDRLQRFFEPFNRKLRRLAGITWTYNYSTPPPMPPPLSAAARGLAYVEDLRQPAHE
ncbi:hypothetical protein AB1Y20_013784 [Prymnesium parvum]|uniref:Sulfotransferase n=1 Tax=Prymnesium parvum TaxID=97485 RepID=A0AB34IDX9_PRYPA